MRRRNVLRLGLDAVGEQPAAAGTVVGWNRVALQAIRALQPDVAAAARALAILHTCMYNAWAAYDDDARQTAHGVAVRLPRAERSAASKASAMSHAAYQAMSGQFPAHLASFKAYMALLGLNPGAPSGQLTPAGIGRTQAAALLDAGRRDGAAGSSDTGGEQADPSPPPAAASTPGSIPDPGHWCQLAQSVSERERYDDDVAVRLFFALAGALADAAGASEDAGQACASAAGEVLRRFTGSALQETAAAGTGRSAGQDLGREAGARAFDKARRYWDGKL
jgi:hypothetical protein